jgi:hypothetical protein
MSRTSDIPDVAFASWYFKDVLGDWNRNPESAGLIVGTDHVFAIWL